MKITLISPYPDLSSPGLRIISACLKKAGHNVQIIFARKGINEKYEEEELNIITNLTRGSDLVGISLMTNFFHQSVQINERIKKELKVPIIWGGVHPTVKPEECLEYADMVCLGEGEEAIVELATKIENGDNFYNIKNICLKDKKGNLVFNPLRPIIGDLNSLPSPDYDLETQYIISKGKYYKISDMDRMSLKNIWDKHLSRKAFCVSHISRGCPFRCAYCYNNTFNKMYSEQKIVRKKSVDKIIEELIEIKKILPFLDCIMLNDDNIFSLSLEYINDFSKKYKENIKLPLVILGGHPDIIDEKKLSCLAEIGIDYLAIGIQTGSEKTKKIYRREYPNLRIKEMAKILKNFVDKIKLICFDIILDNPWEKEKDLTETLMIMAKLPVPCEFHFFSLKFYPGTEIYDLAEKEGLIKNKLPEIYKKDFFYCQKTYFNELFFLFRHYSVLGIRIPTVIIFLLTNTFSRKMGLANLIFRFLYSFLPGGHRYKFGSHFFAKKALDQIGHL